jgi:hypothetical protein
MREKNTLFSNNQHVMTRGFFFVIARVWVHFHGVVSFYFLRLPTWSVAGGELDLPRVPEIIDRIL